jgi:hypothetical protein
LVEVELLVCELPPLAAFEDVELLVDALSGPPGCVLADEPVDVVVPAEPPEPGPVCDDPDADVVVEALPVTVGVGVGVGVVPDGLWVFA